MLSFFHSMSLPTPQAAATHRTLAISRLKMSTSMLGDVHGRSCMEILQKRLSDETTDVEYDVALGYKMSQGPN
jgi:hypothetical protein